MDTRTFARYSGRHTAICGIGVANQGKSDVVEELQKMKDAGKRAAFIKVRQEKYGVFKVNLSGDVRDALFHSMEWAAVHLEERLGQLLLQDYVEMQYEYRIIVLNGFPVCGAGCIEFFTPLNNEEVIFDCKLQARRGDDHPVVKDERIVQQYWLFALQFCREMGIERPELLNYSLDVCMIDGKPSVIELNAFQNLGLYAMNVKEMVRCLAEGSIDIF